MLPQHLAERPKPKWVSVAAFGSEACAIAALKLLENARIAVVFVALTEK